MPRAIFYNVPAHGHVNPSLPLVAELARREHRITYFVTPAYSAAVEAAGAVFQPYTTVRDDFFDAVGLDGTRPQRAAYHLITTAGEIVPELLARARDMQPDYVLYDGMCPWGYLVARILGVPAVASLSLLPSSLRALLKPRVLRIALPMMARDLRLGLEASRRARALGKRYGVAPLGPLTILNAPADLSISYTSTYFHPFAGAGRSGTTDGASVSFVGRGIDQQPVGDAFALEQAHGRPVVYVSLGSLVKTDASFFRSCVAAFEGADAFVVISTGRRVEPDGLGVLPDNIAVYTWVPQLEVLRRAALFITHGGLGSVHDGLFFGVPLLVVPQQEEQALTALRVVELGAGLMLTKAQTSAETIRAYAGRLLAEPRFRLAAQHVGRTLRDAGGVQRAADEIEALLRARNVAGVG